MSAAPPTSPTATTDDQNDTTGETHPSETVDEPRAGSQPVFGRLSSLTTSRVWSWTTVHWASLAVAAVVLAVANRNQWFFGDEWAYIAGRGPGLADFDLFRPHNDHWSTIPLLVFWALEGIVGLTTYLPYVAVVIVLHLGLTHLLWRTCLRAGVCPAIATGIAGIFAVYGAGAENLLWASQIGSVGALTFGWAAVLLHDHDGPFDRRDVAGWAASVTALMFAGNAPVVVAVAALAVWFRRRRAFDAIATAAVPGVVFAVWWLFEGRHAHRVPTPSGARWGIVEWTWNGLAHAVEVSIGVPETGGLLVLALLFWWARHLDLAGGRTAVTFAATLGAVAFYLFTATSRVGLGLDSATPGRYVYYGGALLLPAAALVVSRLVPEGTGPTVFVLGICGLVAFHNVGVMRDETSREMTREQTMRRSVAATAQLLRDPDQPEPLTLDNLPAGALNPDLSTRDLVRLDGYGWLEDDVAVTPTDELTAEAVTQVALVRASDEAALGPVELRPLGADVTAAPEADGAPCVEARRIGGPARIALRADDVPWRVRLRGRDDTDVQLRVELADGELVSEAMAFTLESGSYDLVSGARGHDVLVTLVEDPGPVTVCGVAAA